MHIPLVTFLLNVFLLSCNAEQGSFSSDNNFKESKPDNPYKKINAIPLPQGYKRLEKVTGSFDAFLSTIELKTKPTVYLYNGQPKSNQTAQYAILDISLGNKDLQQCADAVMRLRAEYLFYQKQFEQLIFWDNENTAYRFLAPYTREHFNKYLSRVFGMCGSASLAKQLKPVKLFSAIQPGDVIIRGGFPGHAVIVMDIAMNELGKKIYLLAQSYMPAQDIHVMVNPLNADLSPWYEVNDNAIINTPEYSFTKKELMRW